MVGFGVDHLAGFGPVFFPIGLVVGMVASIYLVIYRFGARR
ncbi:F0F1-ATPase subunit family protein [Frankia sp. R43]|nr:F0F1-ATPase subunit family protein [Frankia sp. R43]